MFKRLDTFLNNNDIIYDLNFGFRQQNFTSNALIDLTENIRKALNNGSIGCGISADLQRTFGTIDDQALLAKLNHCGIRGVSNEWFNPNRPGLFCIK